MSNKLVSVVIPTYKRSDMLGRAIKSVLRQTYSNIEVLVVSDNEPDDEYTAAALKLVESLGDDRVKLITQEHHKNGAAARNAGIKASSGDYIAFLDDDDFWDEGKIEKQVIELETLDNTWGGVSCKNKVYKNGKLIRLQQGYKSGKLYKKLLMRRVEVSTDTILLRRDALFDSGLYDENLLRHQEVQLLTRFTYKYKLRLLDSFLVNVDIGDSQNRPDPEKLRNINAMYQKSVSDIIDTLTPSEKKAVKLMNRFEVGGLYIRQGQKLKGLKDMLCVLQSPKATASAIALVLRKIKCARDAKKYPEQNMPEIG